MRNPEQQNNNETENNPEQRATAAVGAAVADVENREPVETVPDSSAFKAREWMREKATGVYNSRFTDIFIRLPLFGAYKVAKSVLTLAKRLIEKKGSVGFKEGYEIGKEGFSFEADGKKEK